MKLNLKNYSIDRPIQQPVKGKDNMMKQATSFGSVPQFKPSQIVCLECKDTRLYCEVIQVVTWRQLCWVRPLILAEISEDSSSMPSNTLVDLRMTSDLFWPTNLFRSALDTEVIPLLTQLELLNYRAEEVRDASWQLHHFIHQFWQERNG